MKSWSLKSVEIPTDTVSANMKKTIFIIILLTTLASASAFRITTPSYKAESTNLGISASNFSTNNYNSARSLTDHQQPSNKNVSSLTYSLNSGFFNVTVETISINDVEIVAWECSNNNASSYLDCTNIVYGDTITNIRTQCSSGDDVSDVKFDLYNNPDDTYYIEDESYTFRSNDNFTLNTSFLVQDSGDWSLNITCTGNNVPTNTTDWSLPWGTLNISIVSPITDIQGPVNRLINITTRVECILGECGDVNVTLDPKKVIEDVTTEVEKPNFFNFLKQISSIF